MRSHFRTIVVLALTAGLLALFLHNVDLRRVAGDIARARPMWLAGSLSSMVGNLAIRAPRWQYPLAPLGNPTFPHAFPATAGAYAAPSAPAPRAAASRTPSFLS